MVGFIGPNGAGKSTTIKMLSGILYPTSGSIKVSGLIPYKQRKEYVKKIGVVFGQKTQLWWDLPITDTFDLLRYIYKIPDKVYTKNLEIFNELLGLSDFSSQSVRQLSLGQRMRAEVAAALMHDPEIVFFDEPTIGLDVVAKEKIRNFIKQMNREKEMTMLFTTHDMQDVEKTCQRMIIIDTGLKVYDGTVEHIKSKYGKERTLTVEFNEYYKSIDIAATPYVKVISEDNNKKRLIFNREDVHAHQLISELSAKYSVADIAIKEPEIESIIKEIYEGGISIHEGVC